MRALSVAAVLFAVVAVGGCGGKPEFKKFTSPVGKFSAEFPGTPKESWQTIFRNLNLFAMDIEGTKLHTFSVEEREGTYTVGYADLDDKKLKADFTYTIKSSADLQGETGANSFNSESKIALGGKHPGLELGAAGPQREGVVRAYIVGARLYQVKVVGSKSFVESAEAKRFLDSLELTN